MGIVFLGVWLVLYRAAILTNLALLYANWLALLVGALTIFAVAAVLIKMEINAKKEEKPPRNRLTVQESMKK